MAQHNTCTYTCDIACIDIMEEITRNTLPSPGQKYDASSPTIDMYKLYISKLNNHRR